MMNEAIAHPQLKPTHATPYKYSHLKPNANRSAITTSQDLHSRLISILRASAYSDPIHCLIEPANLAKFDPEVEDTKKGYEAISYVWGEPKLTHILYCDNPSSHLMITERLYNILLRLREEQQHNERHNESTCLWIDAICIDQENLLERSQQVQFMTQIYRRASQTHVFLGGGANSWVESEWFTRRWVIQEFVVSPEVIIYHDFHSDTPSSSPSQGDQLSWKDLMEDFDIHRRYDTIDPTVLGVIVDLDEFRQGNTSGILSLLLKFQKAKCGDERDRLFSLIGIANNVSLRDADGAVRIGTRMDGNHPGIINFAADYRMSTKEVYTAFAQAVLRTIAPFDILHCAGALRAVTPTSTTTSSADWPTWAPDWRLPLLYGPLFKTSIFSAGLNISGTKRAIDVTDSAVTITGLHLTKIRELADAQMPLYQETTAETNVLWLGRKMFSQLREHVTDPVELKIADMQFDRVSIETEDGRWGLAPPDVLPGDDVVIFYGARTPFLLRQVPGQDVFRLIGDFYLEGAMSSEDAARYSLLEDKKFTIV